MSSKINTTFRTMSDDARDVRTQRQLGCWLNCWADLRWYGEDLDRSWSEGYRQAVNDIAEVHHRLTPDWMEVWNGRDGSSFTDDEEVSS